VLRARNWRHGWLHVENKRESLTSAPARECHEKVGAVIADRIIFYCDAANDTIGTTRHSPRRTILVAVGIRADMVGTGAEWLGRE
jgi:hypothetical protein